MELGVAILSLIGSYLIGSIPFGFLIAKWLYGVDIRQYGSGNIGATNVYRVLGPVPGLMVLLLDVLKGWLPTFLVLQGAGQEGWAVGAGVAAIAGHSLSPFLRFRGGKGVATSLGVLIGVMPATAGIGLLTWLVVFGTTRWVSLASILASIAVPVSAWLLGYSTLLVSILAAAAGLIIWRHRENIHRLLQGKEPRLTWRKQVARLEEACLDLAQRAIATYVREGRLMEPEMESLPPALAQPGGVFVFLYLDGELQGYMGTVHPRQPTRAHEIIANAVQAAVSDPCHLPVDEKKLPRLHSIVYLLDEPELVQDFHLLNPHQYGVLVEWQGKCGVLLPNFQGIETVEQQLEIAYAKAGIPKEAQAPVYRFTAKRFGSEQA